eukprot:6187583-Pleurochrysis_carterae.AAC.9
MLAQQCRTTRSASPGERISAQRSLAHVICAMPSVLMIENRKHSIIYVCGAEMCVLCAGAAVSFRFADDCAHQTFLFHHSDMASHQADEVGK